MLTIHLTTDVTRMITGALRRAGQRETGGMLFAEHCGEDEFRVLECTVAGVGTIARFLRGIADSLRRLDDFFARTKRNYRRFNYLGEWHSHPSFALCPSPTDDETMFAIVTDAGTNALFAVSIIVKLDDAGELLARAWAYFPDRTRNDCEICVDSRRDHSHGCL